MKVREVMTTDIEFASLDSTLEELATMMRDSNVGAIPVLDEDDDLAGIVTDRDIVIRCIAEGTDVTECTAGDILSEDIHTIEPETSVEEAAELMQRYQVRRLPVVEEGELIGMLSLGDLAVKSYRKSKTESALEGISRGVKESGEGRQAPSSQERGSEGPTSASGGSSRTSVGGLASGGRSGDQKRSGAASASVSGEDQRGAETGRGAAQRANASGPGSTSRGAEGSGKRNENPARQSERLSNFEAQGEARDLEFDDSEDIEYWESEAETTNTGRRALDRPKVKNVASPGGSRDRKQVESDLDLESTAQTGGSRSGVVTSTQQKSQRTQSNQPSPKKSNTETRSIHGAAGRRGGSEKSQGITAHARGQEDSRQKKVVSVRNDAKAAGRRTGAKRKAS